MLDFVGKTFKQKIELNHFVQLRYVKKESCGNLDLPRLDALRRALAEAAQGGFMWTDAMQCTPTWMGGGAAGQPEMGAMAPPLAPCVPCRFLDIPGRHGACVQESVVEPSLRS